jgi:hypothetical protein
MVRLNDLEFQNPLSAEAQEEGERIRLEREQRLAEAQAQQQAQAAQDAAQKREHLETMLMGRFLSNAGTLEGWSQAKAEVVAAHLKEAALHGDDLAHRAMQARYSQ